MSFLTHINRYDEFNYNEDFEESIAGEQSDEEGLFTIESFQSFFFIFFLICIFRCSNYVFFVIQVLILEQVVQFFFFYGACDHFTVFLFIVSFELTIVVICISIKSINRQ